MSNDPFMTRLRRLSKRTLMSLGHDTYHWADNKKALRFLANIEATLGPFDPKHRALCNEYALDVFGKSHYAPWLYTYAAIQGRFTEGWIPDNFYGRTVFQKAKGEYGALSGLKSLTSRVLDVDDDIYPVSASLINGVFFANDGRMIPTSKVKDAIFAHGPKAVFKGDRSGWGRGVMILDADGFSVDQLRSAKAGVIQPFIQQHPSLAVFGSEAATTIRITTVVPPDQPPSTRAIFLRYGGPKSKFIDSDGYFVGMDPQTGALDEYSYDKDWTMRDHLHTSGEKFKGIVVPEIPKLREMALKLHAKIPFVDCIGWDFCVDENANVKLFEWNAAHNSVKFGEAIQGPCFTDMGWEKYAKK